MNDLNPDTTADEFLRHQAWVRSLATDLLRDVGDAEDVVQEAWLVFRRQRGGQVRNIRAWLRGVVRRLALQSHDRRAARRELDDDGVVDRLPSIDTVRESEEARRVVVEAVLALGEPYRTALLLRYFEDRTPEEIARRMGLPGSTVRTHIQRGLRQVKDRLGAKDPRRSSKLSGLLVAAAGPGGSGGAAMIGKVWIMTNMSKAVGGSIAVLLLLVGAVVVMRSDLFTSSAHVVNETALTPPAPVQVASTESALASEPAPLARAPAAPVQDAVTAPKPSARADTLFYGSLLDASGKPLIGLWHAGVRLTDAEGRGRSSDAKESGAFSFHALPFGTYWVSADADGYRTVKGKVTLDESHAHIQQDYTLVAAPILKIRLTNRDGGGAIGEKAAAIRFLSLVPVATKERPGEWLNEVVGSLNNPFGIGQFWQYGPRAEALPKGYMGILMLREDPPAFVSLCNYHRVLQTKSVQPGDEEVEFVLSNEELVASLATIQLQVVDAGTQQPIPNAHAMLFGGARGDGGVSADAQGNIVIADREPGEFSIAVRAKGHEKYSAVVLAKSGEVTDLGRIALDAEVPCVVQVVDGEGHPRAERFNLGLFDETTGKLRVERQQVMQSTGDGTLTLSGMGRHVYVLRTVNHDGLNDKESAGVKWVSGNVILDLRSGAAPAGMVIRLQPSTRVMVVVSGVSADGLRFRVTDAKGNALVESRFYGDAPRGLTLPEGRYKVALVDANDSILSERDVAVGSAPLTVELTR